MFSFLKKKIKETISKITKKVDEEAPEEAVENIEEKEELKNIGVDKPAEDIKRKSELNLDELNLEEREQKKDLENRAKEKPNKEKKQAKKPKENKAEVQKKEEKTIFSRDTEDKRKQKPIEEKKEAEEPIKEAPNFEKPVTILNERDAKKEPIDLQDGLGPDKIKKEVSAEGKGSEAKKGFISSAEETQMPSPNSDKAVEERDKDKPKKEGFFSKIKKSLSTKKLSEEKFEEIFWDLELVLLENNVAVEVIDKIKEDLKKALVDQPIQRSRIEDTIIEALKNSVEELFEARAFNIFDEIEQAKAQQKPYVIAFIGVNGSGKTTSIAKFAYLLQQKGYSVVLAASDTFRAAAIDQLEHHANNLGVKIIKHDYGHDGAAVAFDAIKHAEAKRKDVVLIDTAGRLHSNKNLLEELRKLVRVAKPDIKIFVGESITGNDCIEQAKVFDEMIGIDGIILSKIDVDDKGGTALSVSYVTKKPILFLGDGQDYKNLIEFDKDLIIENLGL